MHFDISRDSFDEGNHFLRVLLEQGRVPIDADFNEQTSILLHRLHQLARDLLGDSWGPLDGAGFEINKGSDSKGYTIGKGRYYVGGCLVENDPEKRDPTISYFSQADYPLKDVTKLPDAPFVFYLDVWEREVDDVILPEFKDPALGPLSSASRSRLVWQVRTAPLSSLDKNQWTDIDLAKLLGTNDNDKQNSITRLGQALTTTFTPGSGVTLAAKPISLQDGSCGADEETQYRGLENQLYRVEIHRTGDSFQPSQDKPTPDDNSFYATFKWSRDNGKAVFPIKTWAGNQTTVAVQLSRTALDDTFSLHLDDWVEYVDDNTALNGDEFLVAALFRVTSIDPYDSTMIVLEGLPDSITSATESFSKNNSNHPFLRRWDQKPGTDVDNHDYRASAQEPTQSNDNALLVVVAVGTKGGTYLQLEDGVSIQFGGTGFRRGDFWLIPARQSTGLVLWPKVKSAGTTKTEFDPKPMPPGSIQHYYAPLAVVNAGGDLISCRRIAPTANQPNLAVEWNKQVSVMTPMAQRRWLIDGIRDRLTEEAFTKLNIPATTDPEYVAKLEKLTLDVGTLTTDMLRAADRIRLENLVTQIQLKMIAKAPDARGVFGTDAPFNNANLNPVIQNVIAVVGELYFLANRYAEVPRTS